MKTPFNTENNEHTAKHHHQQAVILTVTATTTKPLNPPRTTTWMPRFSNCRHKYKPFKINWLQANQPIHPKSQPEPTNPLSPRPTLVEEPRNSNHSFSKWKDIVKWHQS